MAQHQAEDTRNLWRILVVIVVTGALLFWIISQGADEPPPQPDTPAPTDPRIETAPDQAEELDDGPLHRPPGTGPADIRRPATAPYHDVDDGGSTDVDEDGAEPESSDEDTNNSPSERDSSTSRPVPLEFKRADSEDARSIRTVDDLERAQHERRDSDTDDPENMDDLASMDRDSGDGNVLDSLDDRAVNVEESDELELDYEEQARGADAPSASDRILEDHADRPDLPSSNSRPELPRQTQDSDDGYADAPRDVAAESHGEVVDDVIDDDSAPYGGFSEPPPSDLALQGYSDALDEAAFTSDASLYSTLAAQGLADALYLMSAGRTLPEHDAARQRDDFVDRATSPGDDPGTEDEDGFDPEHLPPEDDWTVWLDAVDWLRHIQEEDYPELAHMVDDVEDAAEALDPDLPQEEQAEELADFFELIEVVFEAMALEDEEFWHAPGS